MKLYAISGLGADERVFKYLTLNCELIHISWIKPKEKESIQQYAMRLSQHIDTDEEYGILGVSFGGLIAVEISKKLTPKLTILISSVETKYELRTIYRIFGKSQLIKLLPKKCLNPPRAIAYWLFGTKHKELLNQILNDMDLDFAKWAINELLRWDNEEKLHNQRLKICGTNDKLLPSNNDNCVQLIKHGEHLMIMDKAKEISQMINDKTAEHVQ